jgi:hypothetical protein
MTTRQVRIESDAKGHGRVEIDGREVECVRGVVARIQAGDLPQIELDLVIFEASIDSEAEVVIRADTHAFLVGLGWTPPGGAS